jgi:putative Mg2+ transporter-C (MgtC) family protein
MMVALSWGEPTGQSWSQIGELALALVLSAAIGLERELRQKSAGLRTHTLVGFAAALIVLVSKYGFTDVLGSGVVLDPCRVAVQIVSGIGFIGGGLIFVRGDAVRGLTTAAVVWLTAAAHHRPGSGPVRTRRSTRGQHRRGPGAVIVPPEVVGDARRVGQLVPRGRRRA